MNYPMWYLPEIGGGTMIALIAIIHVFVSHFAVGGGLYLVLAERKGIREHDRGILDFTKKHTKFFLLVTMVFGGLTGVAIWFIISLVHPSATSFLIHTFVFAWATEWVFFLVEIVALFIYFYTFGRMDHRNHQIIGWIYFVAAWISLFIINGIIGFMLTPGGWLQDGDFWSGFFNPTFWPALFFRTFVALMMAGSYAFVTTAFIKDATLKRTMTVFSGKWVLGALLAALPSGIWYVSVLPQPAMELVKGASPTISRALSYGTYAIVGILIVSLLLTLTKPARHNGIYATVVMVCAFLFMGSFEWTREGARRPYVLNEIMYSNSIYKKDVERLNTEGFLQNAKWVRIQEFHEESLLEIGQDLFKNQCYACHTIGGFNNDILPRTANMSFPVLVNYLETIHDRRYFMPPFAGTSDELRALATYIYSGLQGKSMASAVLVTGGVTEMSPGEQLFADNCVFCHEAELIKTKTIGWSRDKIRLGMDNLSGLNPAMPDFNGSELEKEHLSDFILALHSPESKVMGTPHHLGESVFETHCSMCHSLTADYNPLLPKIEGWDRMRLRQALDQLDALNPAMPPLQASDEEKDALADYLMEESREVM